MKICGHCGGTGRCSCIACGTHTLQNGACIICQPRPEIRKLRQELRREDAAYLKGVSLFGPPPDPERPNERMT